jgi:hypothetical protein
MTRSAKASAIVRPLLATAAMTWLTIIAAAPATADENTVRWKTIVGIADAGTIIVPPATTPNNAVGGITGGGQAWTTLGGDARVNLGSGNLEFEVRGLVLAGGNAIGTPDGITQVKGTLVCAAGTAAQAVVDAAPVALSAEGDAEFDGNLGSLPASCTPTAVAFLVRIANGANAGRWIANGAVRMSNGDH